MKRWMALLVAVLLVLVFQRPLPVSARIEFFTASPSSPVTVGTWVELHGRGDSGTCRFTINDEPRAEFAGPECTDTWKTEEFGAGFYTICFELRHSGGWSNAERECKSYLVSRSTSSGSGGSSSGGNSGGNSSSSSTAQCGNAPRSYLHVGDTGYVADVDGSGNRLREEPSTSAQIITTVPVYGGLYVSGGPECHDDYRWWQVQTPNDSGTGMITGWMADGSGSERWIEVGDIGECFLSCGEDGNSNLVTPTPTLAVPQLSLSEPCVAVESARVRTRTSVQACVSALADGLSDSEVEWLSDLWYDALGCSMTAVGFLADYTIGLKNTGSSLLSLRGASASANFSPDVASCLNDVLEDFGLIRALNE